MINYLNLADVDNAVQRNQANDISIKNALFTQQNQERAQQDQMRVRDLVSQAGGDNKTAVNSLMKYGYYQEAGALDKQMGDRDKQRSDIDAKNFETSSKRLEVMGQGYGAISANPEQAPMIIQNWIDTGVVPPEQGQILLDKMPQDLEERRRGAQTLFRSTLEAKDQLSKFETRDAGGQVVTLAIDPVTGAIRTVGTIDKTQSPDNIATNERIEKEGALNRGVQIRGQNLTDERSRETNASGGVQKPLPATALKMQNEAMEKLTVARNINTDLASIETQIQSGKLQFGPISNLKNMGLNLAGMSTEGSRNFATFKSTLEKLRNDSLRLNTGVQTDGDAQRAWNELFQNINDTEFVKQRLGEIRKINERGADLQKLQVENIRSNYNAPQIDYSQYENQPSALGSSPQRQQIIPQGSAGGTVGRGFKILGKE